MIANAGSNKAASSSTTLNTRKLDEETENLSREYTLTLYPVVTHFTSHHMDIKCVVVWIIFVL